MDSETINSVRRTSKKTSHLARPPSSSVPRSSAGGGAPPHHQSHRHTSEPRPSSQSSESELSYGATTTETETAASVVSANTRLSPVRSVGSTKSTKSAKSAKSTHSTRSAKSAKSANKSAKVTAPRPTLTPTPPSLTSLQAQLDDVVMRVEILEAKEARFRRRQHRRIEAGVPDEPTESDSASDLGTEASESSARRAVERELKRNVENIDALTGGGGCDQRPPDYKKLYNEFRRSCQAMMREEARSKAAKSTRGTRDARRFVVPSYKLNLGLDSETHPSSLSHRRRRR